jgi:hypothetical protein
LRVIKVSEVTDIATRVADRARRSIPVELLKVSGRALYSPANTLVSCSPFYFLGLNPGEVPGATESHSLLTIDEDLDRLGQNRIGQHGYLDESWKGYAAGSAPIQRRGQQLFSILAGGDLAAGIELLRRTPTSNIVLRRSTSEFTLSGAIGGEPWKLALRYWPFHQAVIEATACRIIVTHAIGIARRLALHWGLGDGQARPSGWGGTLGTVYAWNLKEGPVLLAIPNLSRYSPDGARAKALASFFSEFLPPWV